MSLSVFVSNAIKIWMKNDTNAEILVLLKIMFTFNETHVKSTEKCKKK